MTGSRSRRDFLQTVAAGGLALAPLTGKDRCAAAVPRSSPRVIRVVVWDEQQPAQKEVYPDFLGNWIARYLADRPGFAVKSVKPDDPQQGLSPQILDACDVLIWWGHVRNSEISPATGKKIVDRIKAGRLALIALHSAHWSSPFVEAMNERTAMNVARRFPSDGQHRVEVSYVLPPKRYTLPKVDSRITPFVEERKFPDGLTRISVHLPICCFPAYRADGKPSYLKVLKPGHPILDGVPAEFVLPHTEMYDEPFHVPEPDEVLLEERWGGGEWFRSGALWKVGVGRVFYFRPGHETFAIYKEKIPLRILENAGRWLGCPSS